MERQGNERRCKGIKRCWNWIKSKIPEMIISALISFFITGGITGLFTRGRNYPEKNTSENASPKLAYNRQAGLLILTNSPHTPITLGQIFGIGNSGCPAITDTNELSILGEISRKETVGIRIDREDLIDIDSVYITFSYGSVPEDRTNRVSVLPPKVDVIPDRDLSQHAIWLKITAKDQDVRIKEVIGVNRSDPLHLDTIKTGEDLPDSGKVKKGIETPIPIEYSIIKEHDLCGVFIRYTDPTIRQSPTIPVSTPETEMRPEGDWLAFYPNLVVHQSLRLIITVGVSENSEVKKDTILTRHTPEESPRLLISKKWSDEGYCLWLQRGNEEKCGPYSLRGLRLERVNR